MTLREGQRALLRVPVADLQCGEVELPVQAARYVARVHRLRPGDRFVAFDPAAEVEAEAVVVAIDRARRSGGPGTKSSPQPRVRVRLSAIRSAATSAVRPVTLIQAMGKGAKLDAIVRDATELGVTRLVPVVSERSIKRPVVSSSTVERYRRIAIEAARQCGRGDAPRVEPVEPLASALERFAPSAEQALALCLDKAAEASVWSALRGLGPEQPLTLVVGPEGGLSGAELDRARSLDYRRVNLGSLVLRTETVCAAVLGAVLVLGAPGSAGDRLAP